MLYSSRFDLFPFPFNRPATERWYLMKTAFDGLYALSEAARLWGKEDSTLRRAILGGKLEDGVDCKKFGKQWVVTKAAMLREYGEPKAGE